MRITYDKAADAAYVYLVDRIRRGEVARTYSCDVKQVGEINLDFDKGGHLLGIEILNASSRLSPETLRGIA